MAGASPESTVTWLYLLSCFLSLSSQDTEWRWSSSGNWLIFTCTLVIYTVSWTFFLSSLHLPAFPSSSRPSPTTFIFRITVEFSRCLAIGQRYYMSSLDARYDGGKSHRNIGFDFDKMCLIWLLLQYTFIDVEVLRWCVKNFWSNK